METVSHLAGPWVEFDGRLIQRCLVCGEKLADSKNVAMMLNPDGTTPPAPRFATGHFIQFTVGQNPRRALDLGDSEKFPEDSCIALVED